MKVLVTGSTGFVGVHLVDHLVAEGDEVIVTSRSSGGPDVCDLSALTAFVGDHRPDTIFHLAGQADVEASWCNPLESFRTNGEGTYNLLVAARMAGVERVVTVTSADIYGFALPDDLPLGESAPLRPVSPYGASKAVADLVALQAHLGFGQEVIRARSFNHFGPGQSDRAVCAALASRIVASEVAGATTIPVGDMSVRRDFTDVRDVVRAYRLLAERGRPGLAYNVCSGQSVSVGHVADRLIALSGDSVRMEPTEELFRPADLPELRGDPTLIRNHTNWTPQIDLESTLTDVLKDWRSRSSN